MDRFQMSAQTTLSPSTRCPTSPLRNGVAFKSSRLFRRGWSAKDGIPVRVPAQHPVFFTGRVPQCVWVGSSGCRMCRHMQCHPTGPGNGTYLPHCLTHSVCAARNLCCCCHDFVAASSPYACASSIFFSTRSLSCCSQACRARQCLASAHILICSEVNAVHDAFLRSKC